MSLCIWRLLGLGLGEAYGEIVLAGGQTNLSGKAGVERISGKSGGIALGAVMGAQSIES